jgi:hypothetical protein
MTLYEKLDWLIDQWCDRRALHPLRFLLSVYPCALVHTDDYFQLLDKLKDVKGLCRNELTQEELGHVISAINEIEDTLKSRSKE